MNDVSDFVLVLIRYEDLVIAAEFNDLFHFTRLLC